MNYEDIIKRLAVPAKEYIRVNEKVTKIARKDDSEPGIDIFTDKGTYTCAYVIVTVSLGVLKHFPKTNILQKPTNKLITC